MEMPIDNLIKSTLIHSPTVECGLLSRVATKVNVGCEHAAKLYAMPDSPNLFKKHHVDEILLWWYMHNALPLIE